MTHRTKLYGKINCVSPFANKMLYEQLITKRPERNDPDFVSVEEMDFTYYTRDDLTVLNFVIFFLIFTKFISREIGDLSAVYVFVCISFNQHKMNVNLA